MAKTGSTISLIAGIAIIALGIMAILSGEQAATGVYVLVPMLFGLYLIVSGIIGMVKKKPIQQPQPLQPVQPSQPAQQAQPAQPVQPAK